MPEIKKDDSLSLRRAITRLLSKNKKLTKENSELRSAKAEWRAKAEIYHKALVNQGIQPVWACSCFRDCSCLEASLKLLGKIE